MPGWLAKCLKTKSTSRSLSLLVGQTLRSGHTVMATKGYIQTMLKQRFFARLEMDYETISSKQSPTIYKGED